MKSSKQMSDLIRAKKKKMMEDPDVIDRMNGIRDDKADLDQDRNNHSTEALDHNDPKERDEGHDLSNAQESEQETHEQDNHKDANANHEDNEKELLRNVRKERIRKIMRG